MTDSLQRSLLPDKLPGVAGVQIEATYLPAGPAAEASGDWYDAVELAEGVALAIGDVVGRGAAAAALAGRLRNLVRTEVAAGCGPAEVLRRANAAAGDVAREMATVLVAVLDPATGELRGANAGHLPALVRRGGSVDVWDAARGVPLGVHDDTAYEEETLTLAPGEVVLLFTDGLVESRGRSAADGLAALRAAVPAIGPVEAVRTAVLEAMIGEEEHDDDVAVLAFGRPG